MHGFICNAVLKLFISTFKYLIQFIISLFKNHPGVIFMTVRFCCNGNAQNWTFLCIDWSDKCTWRSSMLKQFPRFLSHMLKWIPVNLRHLVCIKDMLLCFFLSKLVYSKTYGNACAYSQNGCISNADSCIFHTRIRPESLSTHRAPIKIWPDCMNSRVDVFFVCTCFSVSSALPPSAHFRVMPHSSMMPKASEMKYHQNRLFWHVQSHSTNPGRTL